MLTEEETIRKLREAADQFDSAVREKDYLRAKALYNKSLTVATFMELGTAVTAELFGQHGGLGEHDEAPDGLFSRDYVRRVDLECCIKRNKAYEDQACRRMDQPVRYYSDEDYCARCVG